MTISPVPYFGGKRKIADQITELFPAHWTFVDVFGGGASVLLAKPPSEIEIYNDVDGRLVNLFRVIRDRQLHDKLRAALENTPYSREEFDAAVQSTDDPVESARRFMVRLVQSRMGLGEQFAYCRADPSGSIVRKWHRRVNALPEIRERLRDVVIENLDWRDAIDRYDSPGTLIYCDPPYLASTRIGGSYAHEFTDSDHRQLVARLLTIKGSATLSGYRNEIYLALENAGWSRTDFVVSANTDGRTSRTECIWSSCAVSPVLTRCEKTHQARRANTTKKILNGLRKMEQTGVHFSILALATRVGMSREHLSRNYRELFP